MVVAMMKSVAKATGSDFNSDQAKDMLRATAWTDSADPKVDHYVNAYLAVRRAAGDRLPTDALDPNSNASPRYITAGNYNDLTIANSGIADNYQFTLTGYASVNFNLDYMFAGATNIGMDRVSFSLYAVSGGSHTIAGVNDSLKIGGAGRYWSASMLAPGTYRVETNSSGPSYYNMGFSQGAASLTLDRFEYNDDAPSAAYLAPGDYTVNFHSPTDVDYYYVNGRSSALATTIFGTTYTEFRVLSSDTNHRIALIGTDGVTETLVTYGTPTQPASVTIPDGYQILKVTGVNTVNRYTISVGTRATGKFWPGIGPLTRDLPIRFINPGDPIPVIHTIDPVVVVGFVRDQKTLNNALEVWNMGYEALLYDEKGNVIAKPKLIAGKDPSQYVAQSLDLTSLAYSKQMAFLVLTRIENPTAKLESSSAVLEFEIPLIAR